ncbi:MAG: TolC family protein [Prevotella sp.]|nr:TolC family protein [Prevotella sp.]
MKKQIAIILLSVSCGFAVAQPNYTLQQLKDSALRSNIAVRNAHNSIDAAQQQRKEAFTKYFPNVSGTGLWFNANRAMATTTVNPSEVIPSSLAPVMASSLPPEALAALASPVSISMMKNGVIGSLTAVQPVFAGGQIVNGNRLAKVGEDVSQLQLQLSENEVEKNVTQYFWQAVSLQEKLKTISAAETLLNDIAKDVSVAVRAGVAMPNDLLQVQLRQNDVESQKLKLLNGLSIVKLLTAQYCGLRDTAFILVDDKKLDDLTNLKPQAANPNSQFSIARLPEYQLLTKQVQAANLQTKMAIGENLPTVAVGAGYNYHNLLDNNRTFAMLFATVSVPITAWWGGSYAVKRKKIEQQKAEQQLTDNTQLLAIRMQKAANDLDEAQQQISIAQRSIAQAEENLRLNRNYYNAGTSRMADLLEAQLLYQQACDRLTDAYADYQNKLLAYKHATGQ